MKKIFFLITLTATIAYTSAFSQVKSDSSSVENIGIKIKSFNSAQPIIYTVDGIKQFNIDFVNSINPNEISEIHVLKSDDAIKLFGIEAKGGCVLITTKAGKNSASNIEQLAKLNALGIKYGTNKISDLAIGSRKEIDSSSTTFNTGNSTINIKGLKSTNKINQPLYIVDGTKIENGSIEFLDPTTIQSVTIVKDNSAIKNYGLSASNGVVLITTKPLKKQDPRTELDKN